MFWEQLQADYLLYYFSFGLMLSIAISVGIALTVSKIINPISRSLADVSRTILVWIAGLILTITLGAKNSEYIFENKDLRLNLLKSVAFLAVAYGTLVYH